MKYSEEYTRRSVHQITRRAVVAGGIQAGVLAVLGLRMRDLQVNESDQYQLLAEENRVNVRLVSPARGLIFDRNGVPIAQNEQNYRIVVVQEDAGDVEEVLRKLGKFIDLSADDLARARRELNRRSPFVPVTVADHLSWEDVAEVAVNAPALPGVTPETGLSRHYPLRDDFAHVVGYVGPVSDYDLSKIRDPDPLLRIPKFQIGKVGLENKVEERLRGSAGFRRIEVNAAGRVMRELELNEGDAGDDLLLTVDAGLQNFTQARLEGESASAVVMDVRSGELLAVGSAPSFDPNLFVRGISVANYRKLTDNDHRPLTNKSVQGAYPPGSTFKMVTALAALEAGLIDTRETVLCEGHVEKGDRVFHCWRRGGHGHMAFKKSLQQSCDVYYYDVAERVGIDAITAMAVKLGLGIRPDLPMSAVAVGLTPTKEWKFTRRGETWLTGDTLNASIGQGFVLASPLQLAIMTARIATGTDVSPTLVKSVNGVGVDLPAPKPLDISKESLDAVRAAMLSVTESGTAVRSRIVAEGMEMAGKTGTSQVRTITPEERLEGVLSNEELPWRQRDHALFVSYAPADAPKYAVSVVVEHGGSGAVTAAPIARDIMLRALYGALPPLEAYPEGQRAEIQARFDALKLREIAPRGLGGKARA